MSISIEDNMYLEIRDTMSDPTLFRQTCERYKGDAEFAKNAMWYFDNIAPQDTTGLEEILFELFDDRVKLSGVINVLANVCCRYLTTNCFAELQETYREYNRIDWIDDEMCGLLDRRLIEAAETITHTDFLRDVLGIKINNNDD